MNGTRVPSTAKIFKYGRNSAMNACGQTNNSKPQHACMHVHKSHGLHVKTILTRSTVLTRYTLWLLHVCLIMSSLGTQRYLVATNSNSTLAYTECENDATIWPGKHTPAWLQCYHSIMDTLRKAKNVL